MVLLLGIIGLTGCASHSEVTQQHPDKLSQAQLDAISNRCGLDRSALRLDREGMLEFKPDPDAPYKAIDCALKAVRKFAMAQGRVGYIMNNEPPEGNQ